jgi:hypothetical protein
VKRRKFLALTALLGAELVQAALPKTARASAIGYIPRIKNYMAVHKNAIVIDDAVPMLGASNRKRKPFNPNEQMTQIRH